QAGQSAIYGIRSEQAQATGVGNRTEIGGRRCPAGPLLYPRRDLLAATAEGANADGQQRLQWLPLRRPLAQQLNHGCGAHLSTADGHSRIAMASAVGCLRCGRRAIVSVAGLDADLGRTTALSVCIANVSKGLFFLLCRKDE